MYRDVSSALRRQARGAWPLTEKAHMNIRLRLAGLGAATLAIATGLTAAGFGAPGLAAAATGAAGAAGQPASRIRVSVTGIDRAGESVRVSAVAYAGQKPPIKLSTRPRTIDAGQYWIGATVTTPAGGKTSYSQTLVVRHVTIARNQTVVLDARPGKLLRVSLAVPNATDEGDGVQACLSGGQAGLWSESGGTGTLYVVPVASRDIAFGYSSTWQASLNKSSTGTVATGNPSATYYLAQQVLGGIPRNPVYDVAPGGLAEENLVLRSGTTTSGYQDWLVQRRFSNRCDIDELSLPTAATPSKSTAYLSPGTWQFEVSANGSFWQGTKELAARHSYTDTFGAAVFGPGSDYPTLDFGRLAYLPEEPFGDPLQSAGNECCDRSSISLSLNGRVLKRETMTEYKATRSFSYRLREAGWYTLRTEAGRYVPGGHLPARMLSPSETTTWRFYVSPRDARLDSVTMPVTATSFLPEGLDLENRAPAGRSTRINVRVLRASAHGTSRSYPLSSISVQASYDGGAQWHNVRLIRQGGHWVAFVPAPAAGYVALRSTVTDIRGDSTVQTIYRAYQIH